MGGQGIGDGLGGNTGPPGGCVRDRRPHGGEHSYAQETVFFDYLSRHNKVGMVAKYEAMKTEVPAKDLKAMRRTMEKFEVIVSDCMSQERFKRTGKNALLKRCVIELFKEDFREAMMAVTQDENVGQLRDEAYALWRDRSCPYGQILGEM